MNRGLIQLWRASSDNLVDVDVARGEQYLLDAAVDEVAINVRVGESVIRAQRLDLGDSCVVGTKVPKTNIIEQRGALRSIDSLLPGSSEGTFTGAPVQAEGNRRSLDMALDVGPLDRDLIRSHIDGANDARQGQFQDKSGDYEGCRLLVPRRPSQRKRR